jgi:hypothetical protein
MPMNEVTASSALDNFFIGQQSTFSDIPPATSYAVSTVMITPSAVVTGSPPPYAASSLVITSTSTSPSTTSTTSNIPAYTGAAPVWARVGNGVVGGVVWLLCFVL